MTIQIDRTDGLSSATAIKGPCRVATTANISLAGLQTIDGVVLAAEDRVLVKDQTTASENGIYVVDTGSWRRAKDFSNNRDVRKGTRVWVTDGTVRAETDFLVTAENPISIGTTNITFVAATAPIGDGTVGTTQLADESVTEPKLGDGAVSTRALADEAVTLAKIDDDAKADFRKVGDPSRACSVVYHGQRSVRINARDTHALVGHFFNGQYELDRGRVVDAPAATSGAYHVIDIGNGTSTPGMLSYQTWADGGVWYNMFIAADAADTVGEFCVTPSLRVGSVAGSVITLNNSGENSYSVSAKTFKFVAGSMVGSRCLVVTETLTGRANSWSGRVTTITAHSATTVTLADIGGLAQGDFIIPLPPFDEYKWLGDFYFENAGSDALNEVRNISSDGRDARAYMVNLTDGIPAAGVASTVGTGNRMYYAGNVSPLARRALCRVTINLATGYPVGTEYVEEYDMDSGNHTPASIYVRNPLNGVWVHVTPQIWVEGSYGPAFYFKNAGTVAACTAHSMLVQGWQY
jgi:hypothetical protein